MSKSGTVLNPEYDDFQPKDYDPSFTADINKRMHIPDHLAAMNGHEGEGEGADMKKAQILLNEIHQTSRMNVPDRIVILGQDQSMGMKPDPKLHLDLLEHTTLPEDMYVGLSTPPRVIRLDEQRFPEVYDEHAQAPSGSSHMEKHVSLNLPNGYTSGEKEVNDSLEEEAILPTTADTSLLLAGSDEDPMQVMQRQIAKLSRHVLRLEEENAARSQRELIMYSIMATYVVFQMAKWFLSSK